MVVQHNLTAMNANRQLALTQSGQATSTEKLSSGYRINRAADDAAGLTISEKMRSQIRGLNKASDNAETGISLIQTAEGALNEAHSILQRMNELATQAANDTNTSSDRTAIQKEIIALASELDRIASTTQFNSMNLLSGSFQKKQLQVGALEGQSISITIKKMSFGALFGDDVTPAGVKLTATANIIAKVNMSSFSAAGKAITAIQKAISIVSTQRSSLGALQNRLEHTVKNLDTTAENTQAAESLLRDVDMASEMVEYSKNNILSQAGQSMLAQANQSTQGVLSLLG
ncbi:MAG: flagellin [Lachnospiraceae bacterium]|nr:flagellin [Lachnospiraceae bacterium]MDE6252027.1 flagellin [Lachnospiraceae bacterium]MDE6252028.1 flagellin [Lachnospiraceae bacterium]